MQYRSPNVTLDSDCQTVYIVTCWWSNLSHIVHHSMVYTVGQVRPPTGDNIQWHLGVRIHTRNYVDEVNSAVYAIKSVHLNQFSVDGISTKLHRITVNYL